MNKDNEIQRYRDVYIADAHIHTYTEYREQNIVCKSLMKLQRFKHVVIYEKYSINAIE